MSILFINQRAVISALFSVVIISALALAEAKPLQKLEQNVFAEADADTKAVIKELPVTLVRQLTEHAAKKKLSSITVDYPFDNSVFPMEIVAPTLLWHDLEKKCNVWLIDIGFEDNPNHIYALTVGKRPEPNIDADAVSETNKHFKQSDYVLSARAWRPDEKTWKIIKENCVEKIATVAIAGFNSNDTSKVMSKGSVRFITSSDPVSAPVFYRDVPLMPAGFENGVIQPLAPDAMPLIQWRLRDISKPEAPILLKDMPTCANCHSFSRDGKVLGMDLDGPQGDKGAYGIVEVEKDIVVTNADIITWNDFKYKPESHKTIGFFSQVSPDGKYVVSTVNESIFVVNYMDFKFLQSFYATEGILAYYLKSTGEMKPLPGADDTKYVHCNACWSPDGKSLVFSRARARERYPNPDDLPTYVGDPRETQIQYDLYEIPFNDGKGGVAVPIKGASGNGMSNSFAKYSPDGKWIVFVQSKKGQLMRPDSRLYIVPAQGGQAREMNCNLTLMNSWHSWSPNSRWLVFSSKGFSPFTQMFLTHIDEHGNDTPAILVPNSTADNRAVNIPEFLNNEPDAIASIIAPTQEYHRHFKKGIDLGLHGKPLESLKELEKTVELNPYHIEAYYCMGLSQIDLGRVDEAIHNFRKVLQLQPEHADARSCLGLAFFVKGEFEKAVDYFVEAIKLKPELHQIYGPLEEALTKVPANAKAYHELAKGYACQKNFAQAEKFFKKALEIKPGFFDSHEYLGYVLFEQGKMNESGKHLVKALQIRPGSAKVCDGLLEILYRTPDSPVICNELGKGFVSQNRLEQALSCFAKATKLRPVYAEYRRNFLKNLQRLLYNSGSSGNPGLTMARQGKIELAISYFAAQLNTGTN